MSQALRVAIMLGTLDALADGRLTEVKPVQKLALRSVRNRGLLTARQQRKRVKAARREARAAGA